MRVSAGRFTADTLPVNRRTRVLDDHLALLSLASMASEPAPGTTIAHKVSAAGAAIGVIAGPAQDMRILASEGGDAPFLMLLNLKGAGRIKSQRRMLELQSLDLWVIDAQRDACLEWRSAFDAVVLRLPREQLASRLGRSRIEAPLSLGSTVAATAARSLLRTLAANIEQLSQADLSAGEIAITELVASAVLAEMKAPNGAMTGVQADHFRRIAAAIDGRLGDPDLAVKEIARAEGMSARYVQRLFTCRDETFSDYVRRQRLHRCRADLSDPNHAHESVASIALRWGFKDQAHFSRAFSAEFGHSPRDARRTAGAGGETAYPLRGRPVQRTGKITPLRQRQMTEPPPKLFDICCEGRAKSSGLKPDHVVPVSASTVHWGFLSRSLPPVLRIDPGQSITIETLTQHAGDDPLRMIAGDGGAESVYLWTRERKAVDRRGAGPMNASVFGRGAGEGFGVHICTGPIYVNGAEAGDILEVEILDIRPRESGNPAFKGKAFASNASAWWGYQYHDLLDEGAKRETVTIYEIDLADPSAAVPLYSYVWQPQTDPFGVEHRTMDYPGVLVDPSRITRVEAALAGVRIPARPHFGFIGVAPADADIVDSIPPGNFGGNIDNWRAGKGSRLYLPVAVEGGLLSLGDGHFAQADGEINGTGLECSLTGDIRVRLHKRGAQAPKHLTGLSAPLIETETHWVIQSFSYPNYLTELGREAQSAVYKLSTVDLALRSAFRQTRRFLMDVYDLTEDEALSLMSLAVDFGVTQVADGNFGVHATIEKAIFKGRGEMMR